MFALFSNRYRTGGSVLQTAGWYLLVTAAFINLANQLPADDGAAGAEKQLFELKIAPLLERSCVQCHNAEQREGGLALDSAAGLLAGGDSGPVVLLDDPLRSPLLEAILPSGSDNAEPPAMPKGRPALVKDEIAVIRSWLEGKAVWPEGQTLTAKDAPDAAWWSLQPLSTVATPLDAHANRRASDRIAIKQRIESQAVNNQAPTNFVDGFIRAKQREVGLEHAPRAARRELIRRVSFDLMGLPPTIDEVNAYVSDERPDAYERLVDRWMASPAYGERWARHWLDVVHYGETHGYDKDKLRLNAWPYRDYVIRSLNNDKPYRQFVAEQVAGDVLSPNNSDAIEAVGFLSAGPWDFIGHAEVPETRLDGKIARHLDRDDMVQNTFLTFQSLTIGCAQCHNHKFDPISQQEYYGLQAVFAALDRADRQYYRDPDLQARYTALQTLEQSLRRQKAQYQEAFKQAGGEALADLDKQLSAAQSTKSKYPAEHGYHSNIETSPEHSKWVQIDLGAPTELSRIEWVACHDDFAGIGDGFGAPPRWRIETSNSADFSTDRRIIAEQTDAARNPGIEPQSFAVKDISARYVRFTAMQLALRQNDYIFALAELRTLDRAGANCALGKPVSASDSIDAPVRWARANLVDDKYPVAANKTAIDKLAIARAALIERVIPPELREREHQVTSQLATIEAAMKSLPPPATTYLATIYHGQGPFSGTGSQGGKPRVVQVLPRGDVSRAGPEAVPCALACLSSLDPQLGSIDSSDAHRRAALARWLTDSDNPLTWRSIANRIWSYQFHRGIVDTPNDFGRMGGMPTHPELLDQLAIHVRDHQSLKKIQRLLLLSATYQQSSQAPEGRAEADPDNRLLARSPRKRLGAEAIRDAMLSVAGLLRREMGGPSYQDFVIERPEHSPHYEYALHDPRDPATMRRSIYRFIARSQTQPLMTSLDCADPSMQVDVRNESNSATQALTLLNNAFTLMAAEEWAARAATHRNAESVVQAMFADATSREPSAEELQALQHLANQHGLTTVARVVFNLNEFLYVD